MTKLSELFPAFSGAIKSQKFTANGTFTPSAALLAKGGWVYLRLKGGGGGGGLGNSSTQVSDFGGDSGGAGHECEGWVKVSGPVSVNIGARGEGADNSNGSAATAGGDTSFGSYKAMGGGPGRNYNTGVFSARGNPRGERGQSYSRGGIGPHGWLSDVQALPGSGSTAGAGGVGYGAGGGGAGGSSSRGGAGAPGYCEVFWEE